jgi:hypothetical protein
VFGCEGGGGGAVAGIRMSSWCCGVVCPGGEVWKWKIRKVKTSHDENCGLFFFARHLVVFVGHRRRPLR